MNSLNCELFKPVLLGITVTVLVVGLSACGKPVEKMLVEEASSNAEAPPADDVSSIIAQAQAKHDEAMALSHGWTRTQPLIDRATVAEAEGDEGAARALAERALLQASASVEQAHLEVNAWKARVPK